MEVQLRKPAGARKKPARYHSRINQHRLLSRGLEFSATEEVSEVESSESTPIPVPVCLLSSHPLGARHISGLLSPACDVKILAVQNVLDSKKEEETVPAADVYIVYGCSQLPALAASVDFVLRKFSEAKILVLLENLSENIVFPVLQRGVQGVLLYDQIRQQLCRSISEIARGGYWVPREILSKFVHNILKVASPKGKLKASYELSRREREVTDCVLANLTNKEIANRLNISERTAKFHVSNILSKFEVQRRADLILLSYQNRI